MHREINTHGRKGVSALFEVSGTVLHKSLFVPRGISVCKLFLISLMKLEAERAVDGPLPEAEEHLLRTFKERGVRSIRFGPHWDRRDDTLDAERDNIRQERQIKVEKKVSSVKKSKTIDDVQRIRNIADAKSISGLFPRRIMIFSRPHHLIVAMIVVFIWRKSKKAPLVSNTR